MKLISREVFVPSPAKGTGVMAFSYYTQKQGDELLEMYQEIRRSDTVEAAHLRRSLDNGKTWSQDESIPLRQDGKAGKRRRFLFPGYLDPGSGRLLTMRMEGVLPTDNPLEGMKHWLLYYTVSNDGGRTNLVDRQVIQQGDEFTATHPLPDVWNGKNALQIGALSCVPLTLPDGTILVPCQSSPLDAKGRYYNPGGSFTYTDAMVLRGHWNHDDSIAWESAARIKGDPAKSTRGLIEPTLALLQDGRVMMVMRGSNDTKPALPGYKWVSYSSDEGRDWTTPVPWTYDDRENFFSPSSCSQLFRAASGKLLWFGNISPANANGNSPRYPLVAGEVDQKTGLLIKDSVATIDTREPRDGSDLQLSNFYVRQDRVTGEIVLNMTRLNADGHQDMTADAMIYRIALEP